MTIHTLTIKLTETENGYSAEIGNPDGFHPAALLTAANALIERVSATDPVFIEIARGNLNLHRTDLE